MVAGAIAPYHLELVIGVTWTVLESSVLTPSPGSNNETFLWVSRKWFHHWQTLLAKARREALKSVWVARTERKWALLKINPDSLRKPNISYRYDVWQECLCVLRESALWEQQVCLKSEQTPVFNITSTSFCITILYYRYNIWSKYSV